jgi:hypothetical protein
MTPEVKIWFPLKVMRGADLTTAAAPTEPAPSRWGPFGHLAFTVIWTASLVSNVDTADGRR